MGPKAKAGRTASASKPKGRRFATKGPPTKMDKQQKTGAVLDKAKVKTFLGHVQYHAGLLPKKMPKVVDDDAKTLLQLYHQSSSDEKHALIEKFNAPNGKKLAWVKEFKDYETEKTEDTASTVEDWCTGVQILKMNQFDPKDYDPEKQAAILQAIITESEEKYDYKSETKEHPSKIPDMVKYWYVHGEGIRRSRSSASTTEISGNTEISPKQDLCKIAVADCKPKNPDYDEVKFMLKQLGCAKTALDKHVAGAEELLSVLHAKVAKGDGTATKARDDLADTLSHLKKETATMLDTMGVAECTCDDDDCSELVKTMKTMQQAALNQHASWKLLLKQYNNTWRKDK
jgi:hypothetical protein